MILLPGDRAVAIGNATRGAAVIEPAAMVQPAVSTCAREPLACEVARQAF